MYTYTRVDFCTYTCITSYNTIVVYLNTWKTKNYKMYVKVTKGGLSEFTIHHNHRGQNDTP